MELVRLVDENGKEIKVDETNVNEFVIRNAVELTKEALPKNVGCMPTGKVTTEDTYRRDG